MRLFTRATAFAVVCHRETGLIDAVVHADELASTEMRAVPVLVILLAARMAYAEPHPFTVFAVAQSTKGWLPYASIGSHISGFFLSLDASGREHDLEMETEAIDLRLRGGGWLETGRWNFVGGIGAGAAYRYRPLPLFKVRGLGWTPVVGVRGGVWFRFAQTTFAQREGVAVNFGLGVEGDASVVWDGVRVASIGLAITVWRSDLQE